MPVPVLLGRVAYAIMLSEIICGHVRVHTRVTVTWTILQDLVLVSNAPTCVAFSHARKEEMFYFIQYTDICICKFTNLFNIYILHKLYYMHL